MQDNFISDEFVISTHALTEGDISMLWGSLERLISTHALTEGDSGNESSKEEHGSISTHALTEGDCRKSGTRQRMGISTHALTEGDLFVGVMLAKLGKFQLTPSRRATANLDKFFF